MVFFVLFQFFVIFEFSMSLIFYVSNHTIRNSMSLIIQYVIVMISAIIFGEPLFKLETKGISLPNNPHPDVFCRSGKFFKNFKHFI